MTGISQNSETKAETIVPQLYPSQEYLDCENQYKNVINVPTNKHQYFTSRFQWLCPASYICSALPNILIYVTVFVLHGFWGKLYVLV